MAANIGVSVNDGFTAAKIIIRDKDNVVVDKFFITNMMNFSQWIGDGNKVTIEPIHYENGFRFKDNVA